MDHKTNIHRFEALHCEGTGLMVEILDVRDVWGEQLAEDLAVWCRLVDQRNNRV